MDKYETARSSLLTICIFTIINMFLMVLGSNIYFIYAAQIPQYIFVIMATVARSGLIVSFLVSLIPMILLLICWYLSSKSNTWMVIATIIYGIDFVLVVVGLASGFDINYLIQFIISAYIMYTLVAGLLASKDFWKIAKRKRPNPSEYLKKDFVVDMSNDD